MGALTRAQIVAQGLLIAGRTDLTTQGNIWLNAFLRDAYRSWSWPYLHKTYVGLSLPSGTTSLLFGAGSTETLEVPHIFDPIRIYTSDKSMRENVRVRQWTDGDAWTDEDLQASTDVGLPRVVRLLPSNASWGKWTLRPYPTPDRDYLLKLRYLIQPADIDTTSGGDSTVPIYPNDETMIQAVKTAAFKYMREDELAQSEQQRLDALKQGDKVRYGVVNGINDRTDLDSQVFRSGPGRGARWNDYW